MRLYFAAVLVYIAATSFHVLGLPDFPEEYTPISMGISILSIWIALQLIINEIKSKK